MRFTGWLSPRALVETRAGAGVVLVPSRCEEACPYSVLDALAAAIPVLASDRGALPELVGTEAVLPPDDTHAWTRALDALWREPEARRDRGEGVLAEARERFGEAPYHEALMEIYGS